MEQIEQKQYGVTLRFELGEEDGRFTYKERSGEVASKFRYEDVDVNDIADATLRYSHFYRVGMFTYMFFLAVGALHCSLFPHEPDGLALVLDIACPLFILAGIALCLRRVAISYSLLNAGSNKIRVMHGKEHDRIMNELRTRWRTRMRTLHGFLNFANDRDKELQKFIWLKQIGVIDAEEFQSFTDKLRLFMPKTPFRHHSATRQENQVH